MTITYALIQMVEKIADREVISFTWWCEQNPCGSAPPPSHRDHTCPVPRESLFAICPYHIQLRVQSFFSTVRTSCRDARITLASPFIRKATSWLVAFLHTCKRNQSQLHCYGANMCLVTAALKLSSRVSPDGDSVFVQVCIVPVARRKIAASLSERDPTSVSLPSKLIVTAYCVAALSSVMKFSRAASCRYSLALRQSSSSRSASSLSIFWSLLGVLTTFAFSALLVFPSLP